MKQEYGPKLILEVPKQYFVRRMRYARQLTATRTKVWNNAIQ